MRPTFKIVIAFFTCFFFLVVFSPVTASASCGTIKDDPPLWGTIKFCDFNNNNQGEDPVEFSFVSCTTGQANDGPLGASCCNTVPECGAILNPTVTPTPRPPTPTGGPPPGSPTPSGPIANPLEPPTDAFFDLVDPLQHGGGQTVLDDVPSAYASQLRTPGGIVSRMLVFAFPLAGLILFFMLVWAGLAMLVGAPSKKSIDAGKQRATAAIVGFLLLFATYWIFQIIEVVFGVRII